MPGRRPQRITGRVVNTVARRWVGAPNERTSFSIHDAVVSCRSMSVEDSESRRLELKKLAQFFSGQSWPKICPGQELFSSFFWSTLKLFLRRFALIASCTEILWRVSLKLDFFLATSRFHCHRSNNTPINLYDLRAGSSEQKTNFVRHECRMP